MVYIDRKDSFEDKKYSNVMERKFVVLEERVRFEYVGWSVRKEEFVFSWVIRSLGMVRFFMLVFIFRVLVNGIFFFSDFIFYSFCVCSR